MARHFMQRTVINTCASFLVLVGTLSGVALRPASSLVTQSTQHEGNNSACGKHIVVLYDFSGSVIAQDNRVSRANRYVKDLLFENLSSSDLHAEDYAPSNTLRDRGLTEPLFQPGDCLSFFSFGMEEQALTSILPNSSNPEEFWRQFVRLLIHPSSSQAPVLPDSLKAQQFLEQQLPKEFSSTRYYYTLSYYSLPALLASMPPFYGVRTLIIRVSDLFSGQGRRDELDRALVARYAQEYLPVLDRAQQTFYQYFSLEPGLLQLSIGGYEGLKLQVLEVLPREIPKILFSKKKMVIEQQSDLSWRIHLPILQISSIAPERTSLFHPQRAELELYDPDSKMSSLRIPVEKLKDIPFGSSRELGELRIEAGMIPPGVQRLGAKIRWKVLYSVPELHKLRLPLVLETQEIWPAIQRLAPPSPWWRPLVWILDITALVLLIVWFLRFRNPWWELSPLQPKWQSLPDIEGHNEPKLYREDRKYWRLTWREGLKASAETAVRNTSDRFNYNSLTVRVCLTSINKPPSLNAARLWLELPGKNTRYGPSNEVLIGPLKPRQQFRVSLWLDLSKVPEPQPNPSALTDASISFRMEFRDKKGGRRIIEDGIIVEENPGTFWLGIDPGTSGACIAGGQDPDNLGLIPFMSEKSKLPEPYIVPSLVYICRDEEEAKSVNALRYKLKDDMELPFICGTSVQPYEENYPERLFVSAKRLIGHEISRDLFFEGRTLKVRGADAVSMLVKYLASRAEDYLQKTGMKAKLNKVVLAVPNNFTPAKIQEMKECCKVLPICRVEHIYEAEATLMYYLWKGTDLLKNRVAKVENMRKQQGEHVLIVDFGGASINLSYGRINYKNDKTTVLIIQRIGYAFGGNRIDWEIGKIIWEGAKESSAQTKLPSLLADPRTLGSLGGQRDNWLILRTEFRDISEKTKIKLCNEWHSGRKDNEWKPLAGSSWSNSNVSFSAKSLLARPEIQKVFAVLGEAVNELHKLCASRNEWFGVDTLLFSGRSSQFPTVHEVVKEAVNNTPHSEGLIEVILGKQAKTCVAMGAAYWAIQQDNIKLQRACAFAHYGVERFGSLDLGSKKFVPLIAAGKLFDKDGLCSGMKTDLTFPFNAGRLRFYQIMGSDPQLALQEKAQSHKRSLLGKIDVGDSKTIPTEELGIQIDDRDTCSMFARFSGETYEISGRISIQDLLEDQDESIFWFTLPPKG